MRSGIRLPVRQDTRLGVSPWASQRPLQAEAGVPGFVGLLASIGLAALTSHNSSTGSPVEGALQALAVDHLDGRVSM